MKDMSQTTRRTNEELTTEVVDELRWLPSVDSTHITVSADGGCVTLTGEVRTYPETLLSAKAALGVRGVTAVAQELQVRGPFAAPTDSEIGRFAAEALTRSVNVPQTVKATVHEQQITLTGEVAWQFEREAACRAVNEIHGVKSVRTLMTLRPGTATNEIRNHIVSAFLRNAEFDGKNLKVTSDLNGVVTLGGVVRSAVERRVAEQVCWSAAGVTEVVNELLVDS